MKKKYKIVCNLSYTEFFHLQFWAVGVAKLRSSLNLLLNKVTKIILYAMAAFSHKLLKFTEI